MLGNLAPDCEAQVREVLATAQAIRENIENDQDRIRFQPAVQIIDQLSGVTPDQLTVPATQNRILEVGAQLQSWLAKNFVG